MLGFLDILCHVAFLFGLAGVVVGCMRGCLLAGDLSACVCAVPAAAADLSTAHAGHSTCTYCMHVVRYIVGNCVGILWTIVMMIVTMTMIMIKTIVNTSLTVVSGVMVLIL